MASEVAMSPQGRGPWWVEMNDILLEQIFILVCMRHGDVAGPMRHDPNLPLVCRRWRDVYENSPLLWRQVALNWSHALASSSKQNPRRQMDSRSVDEDAISRFGYISKWLQVRAPYLHRLSLSNTYVLGPALHMQLQPLCAHAVNLELIEVLGLHGSGDAAVLALRSAENLRSIKLSWDQPSTGPTTPLRISVSSLKELSSLQKLESIDLEVDSLSGGTSADLVTWSALRNLASLRLAGRMESVIMHPDMVASLSNLHRLELSNVRLPQFSPAMVNALGHVSYLGLSNILAAKPRRKSGFTLWDALPGLRSLRHLCVSGAGQDAGFPASALACSGLRSLSLSECSRVGKWGVVNGMIPTDIYKGMATLESLHLNDVGLLDVPPAVVWRNFPRLTALTWSAVHKSAPRHRYWDHGGACLITSDMDPVLRALCVLRFAFSGLSREQLSIVGHALHAANQLQELNLEGNRLSGSEGRSVANALIRDKVHLVRLSLANCGLNGVPSEIFSLSSLKELDLTQNPGLRTCRDDEAHLSNVDVVKRNDRQAVLESLVPRVSNLCSELSVAQAALPAPGS